MAQFGAMPRLVEIMVGQTIATMFEQTGVEIHPEVDFVRVNGRAVEMDYTMQDQDQVVVLPKIIGG
jgi:molybdopterin converting factor small subunit